MSILKLERDKYEKMSEYGDEGMDELPEPLLLTLEWLKSRLSGCTFNVDEDKGTILIRGKNKLATIGHGSSLRGIGLASRYQYKPVSESKLKYQNKRTAKYKESKKIPVSQSNLNHDSGTDILIQEFPEVNDGPLFESETPYVSTPLSDRTKMVSDKSLDFGIKVACVSRGNQSSMIDMQSLHTQTDNTIANSKSVATSPPDNCYISHVDQVTEMDQNAAMEFMAYSTNDTIGRL